MKFNVKRIKQIADRINPKTSINEKSKTDMSIRDSVRLMRKKQINEEIKNSLSNSEIEIEKNKFLNVFKDNNVTVQFKNFLFSKDGVFFSGTIDGIIQWAYRVTPDENSSGIDYEVIDGFDGNDPENADVLKKLESYYDTFYEYCRDNIINIDNTENNQ